jgi:hypothetical protein
MHSLASAEVGKREIGRGFGHGDDGRTDSQALVQGVGEVGHHHEPFVLLGSACGHCAEEDC